MPLSRLFYHENLAFSNSLEDGPHQFSEVQKKLRFETSVELLALFDQYSEFHVDGIAASDEPWFCYLIDSESLSARQSEEVTPRLRPGFSIKIVMMRFFASTR
jgi:hypothetical protein